MTRGVEIALDAGFAPRHDACTFLAGRFVRYLTLPARASAGRLAIRLTRHRARARRRAGSAPIRQPFRRSTDAFVSGRRGGVANADAG